jgi:hypothetical protein
MAADATSNTLGRDFDVAFPDDLRCLRCALLHISRGPKFGPRRLWSAVSVEVAEGPCHSRIPLGLYTRKDVYGIEAANGIEIANECSAD